MCQFRRALPILMTVWLLAGPSWSGVSDGLAAVSMPLWPAGAPDDNGLSGSEKEGGCTGNISRPTLTVYFPSADRPTAAVVIIPGGGYGVVCDDTEGKQIAKLLAARGIAAAVLKYRLPNGHHLVPARDARRAIQTVRSHAKSWNIDAQRVGVWGFSAGGHLASTVSTVASSQDLEARDETDKLSARPDFSILFYPVISMQRGVTHTGSRRNLLGANPSEKLVKRYSNEQQVGPKTPPTFLLHAADDQAVPVENSLRYYRKLLEHGVPARMIVFEKGGHGPSAFQSNPSWLAVFEEWLSSRDLN